MPTRLTLSIQSTFNATTMICVSRAFRDSLVEVGQDNSAAPGLAESWESSADAKTWRFKLRNGVEFSRWQKPDHGRRYQFHQRAPR